MKTVHVVTHDLQIFNAVIRHHWGCALPRLYHRYITFANRDVRHACEGSSTVVYCACCLLR